MYIMAHSRKHKHKSFIKLTRKEIILIEDEWFRRFNANTQIKYDKVSIIK